MRVLQSTKGLPQDIGSDLLAESACVGEPVEDVPALAELEDDVATAPVVVTFQDSADVRVIQLLQCSGLLVKGLPIGRVGQHDLLDGDSSASHMLVFGYVHLTEATRAGRARVHVVALLDHAEGALVLRHPHLLQTQRRVPRTRSSAIETGASAAADIAAPIGVTAAAAAAAAAAAHAIAAVATREVERLGNGLHHRLSRVSS
mmetsp:Transcript_33763/g.96850  ORF Transcript_33763/g.96850 Transcript_33763/m.96850 type:complete len:203 (-) Transcript_33763:51-659(-)